MTKHAYIELGLAVLQTEAEAISALSARLDQKFYDACDLILKCEGRIVVTGSPLGGVSSHAEIGGECSRCHTAPWQKVNMSDQCLLCHETSREELNNESTLHGSLYKNNVEITCQTCHLEHRGINSPSTYLHGLKIPHDSYGFSLISHKGNIFGVDAECTDCHADDFLHVDPKTCGNCHILIDSEYISTHITAFGPNCLECHDGMETFGNQFDHQIVKFPLDGRHAEVDCSDCHVLQFSIEDLRSTSQSCYECHQDEDKHLGNLGLDCAICHTPEDWNVVEFDHDTTNYLLEGKHADTACESCHVMGVLKNSPKNCNDCHVEDDKHEGKYGITCQECHNPENWNPIGFDHSIVQYELVGKHLEVSCEKCHVNNDYPNISRNCSSCHRIQDPHLGSLGLLCENCHTESDWLPSSFVHGSSLFKLTGRHLSVSCKSCHATSVYDQSIKTCSDCHFTEDIHNGGFGLDCGLCHSTSNWKGATYDHTKANFPLTGRHISITCQDCHANGSYKGTPTTCYACHTSKDEHNGSFGTDCGTCHTTSTWTGATFNHSNTAFTLTGSHIQVNCTACHTNGVYKGTPTACYACHVSQDEHNGSFGTDCGTCHTTSTWTGATFNHSNTAFTLTGSHVQVNCNACHTNGVYQGTPTTCYACHASQDEHNGSFGTDCGTCHTTSTWSGANFNHNLFSFNLSGKHQEASCNDCHSNGVYNGTPTTCESCHNPPNEHDGGLPSNCEQCHTSQDWDAEGD